MTKKTDPRNSNPIEYEQGRRARLASVSREEAPYADMNDQDGKPVKSATLAAWQAGWDDAEGEAARDATSGPDSPIKADDQIKTVADANKK